MPTNINDSEDDHEAQGLFGQGLRRFRPVAPSPLNLPERRYLPAFAAAAAVLAIIALPIVQQYSSRPPSAAANAQPQADSKQQHLTTAQLRTALLAGDDELNRQLDDASPKILPHSQPGTVLYELGKE